MIKVSGYSDDLIDVTIRIPEEGWQFNEQEYDCFDKDMLFRFDDGTKLRMTYQYGTWRALIEESGTAQISIEPLINNDDWYSDLFTIETNRILKYWKEPKSTREGIQV